VDQWLHNTRGLVIVVLAIATGVLLLAIDPGNGFPQGVGAASGGGGSAVVTTTTIPATGSTTTTPAAARPTLQEGSQGADVITLQQRLTALGYNVGAADGAFGATTKAAVIAFQAKAGLPQTGVVDPATWTALDKAK
jgi:peptidoglycan hydrolase-like protein with peptidoglycan-binding domain